MCRQSPVGIPAHGPGRFLHPWNSRIPLRHSGKGGEINLGRQLKRCIRSLLAMLSQLIHFVVRHDPQIPEWLCRSLRHYFCYIHLLLLSFLITHTHLHHRHGESPPMGPGVISCQLTHIQINVVPSPIFRQRQTIAVQNQAPRGRQKNRNRSLLKQRLRVFLPLDNLHDKKSLQ